MRTVGGLVRGAVADVLLTPHVDPDPGSLQTPETRGSQAPTPSLQYILPSLQWIFSAAHKKGAI